MPRGGGTDIDENGRVHINGKILEESYVSEFDLGDCDVEFPYTVPAEEFFVLGDKRANSVDSRSAAIGTVSRDEIIGEVFFRVSPFGRFGFVE